MYIIFSLVNGISSVKLLPERHLLLWNWLFKSMILKRQQVPI